MSPATAGRPAAGEHHEYYGTYVAKVPHTDAVEALEAQHADMMSLLRGLSEAQGGLRYAPGKWSVREVLGHLIDAERVFAYRALCIARADTTPLPGFDQDPYVAHAAAEARTLRSLVDELDLVRRANLAMFQALPAEAWLRRGEANGTPVTVRALAFIMAGHGWHHVGILRERYLA